MKLQPLITDGLTVAQLKRHIADWPEIDASGEPTEVWIQTSRGSCQCLTIDVLNLRTRDDGTETSDLLFS